MNYLSRSPKSEVRSPKQGRTAKSEGGEVANEFDPNSGFWTWGDELKEQLALREGPPPGGGPPLDLAERTAQFMEAIIRFARKIPKGPVTNRLIDQLVGAGTSVGANYFEAKDAVSRKDFKNRVGTSRKESKETMFFLRMVAAAEENLTQEARLLWCEAKQLNLIFGSIWRK